MSRTGQGSSAFSTALFSIGMSFSVSLELMTKLTEYSQGLNFLETSRYRSLALCELHDHHNKEEEKKCWAWRDSLVKKGSQAEWRRVSKCRC
jgi:hypothetical protein